MVTAGIVLTSRTDRATPFYEHLLYYNDTPQTPQIELLQQQLAEAAKEPNFVSAICRALEGTGAGGRERAEQPHQRGRGGGTQGQQGGGHRITEEFVAGTCACVLFFESYDIIYDRGL